MKFKIIFFISFISCICLNTFAQSQNDSVNSVVIRRHSPNRAANMSALVPGLGQVYNKKYWKLPIIYGGGAALIYAITWNNRNYQKYLTAYKLDTDTDTNTHSEFVGIYSTQNLITLKDYYRRYRDLSAIGLVSLYAANIIDAYVDAHFYYFDVSDDLSLKIDPYVVPMYTNKGYQPVTGLSLTFNIK
jgi:hypothetical protein